MFFKKSENKIKFYASEDGLEKDYNLFPYPAKKYVPSWWTDIPNQYNNWPTVRRCPAVPDFFNSGYIIPMWRDIKIFGIDENNNVKYIAPNSAFRDLSGHNNNQLLSHKDIMIGNRKVQSIIKFDSPWNVITPKGWSTLVLPLFYEFNQNYTILPGIVDTDIFHQMNHPALLHCDNNHFEIESGKPFIMYIPFKRTKNNYEIIAKKTEIDLYMNQINNDWINKQELHLGNGYGFKNAYRKMQKEKNKNV